jgi:VanZ family protein
VSTSRTAPDSLRFSNNHGFIVTYLFGCLLMISFLTWSLLSPDPYAIVRGSSLNWLENISDLLAHLTAFSLFSASIFGWYLLTARPIPIRAVYATMAYCLILEGLQVFVPGRHCDAKDAMANLCGFVLGLAFVRVISLFRRPTFAN